MNIQNLNNEFAINGHISFSEGRGDLPVIEIQNQFSSATISLYGGQVLSYRPVDDSQDMFFLSELAYYKPGKAIKGGVPICWPWFGPDPENKGRPAHGFARDSMWTMLASEQLVTGQTYIRMGLADSEKTRLLWPYEFELTLDVMVGEQLQLILNTKNTGAEPFSITQALHSYFRVGDISRVAVQGLEGVSYIDKLDDGKIKLQQDAVHIDKEADRIYTGTPEQLTIQDEVLKRHLILSADNSSTTVVWNPWIEKTAAMADLNADDYNYFLCVETANAANETIALAPGEEYSMGFECISDVAAE